MFESKIKNYLSAVNFSNSTLKQEEFKNLKKGDIVELHMSSSKKKAQILKGICIKKKGADLTASLTIEYKISNEVVQQKFPISLPSILKITKILK